MNQKKTTRTPLQQAIDELKLLRAMRLNPHSQDALTRALNRLTDLLPTEREFANKVFNDAREYSNFQLNERKYPNFDQFYSQYETEK